MDLKKLLRSRRAQVAGAVGAAGVAAVVWYRGRKAAAAPTVAGSSDSSSSPGTVAGGFPDTSGSDQAAVLGNNIGSLDDALAGFAKSIGDIQKQLASMQPQHATNGSTPPIVAPKPVTLPKARTVTVTRFDPRRPSWSSTLSGIAGHEHTSVGALLRLNPSIKDPDVIRTGSSVRVA